MKNLILLTLALFAITPAIRAIRPDTVYLHHPEHMGLLYRDLTATTGDGYRIPIWFFPAQTPLSMQSADTTRRPYQTLDSRKRPTIIICTGDASNMSYYQLRLARGLTAQGFNVVTFDWRGFGHSDPFPMDSNYMVYTEMLDDYEAVVNLTARQTEVDRSKIALMGWSTGGYLSMITAHRNPHVAAMIGRGIPTSFDELIPLVMEVRHKTRANLLIPDDFPQDEMPAAIAPKFRKPLMLIVGDGDRRTPVWMSEKVLSRLPGKTPRELMVVEGAAHGGMEAPEIIRYEEFVRRVSDFLHKHL